MVRAKGLGLRPRTIFLRKTHPVASAPRGATGRSLKAGQPSDRQFSNLVSSHDLGFAEMIPDVFTQPPPVRDDLVTETSIAQNETVAACLPSLAGEDENAEYNAYGVPKLRREDHIRFLRASLGKLPGRFIAADASRPWFLYWCLQGLSILGYDVSVYRESVVETARTMQNDTGGFGGGGKQLSHLATTYAVLLALALVGGENAYEVVDRRAMWKWLCSLKQPGGGFQVCLGGEEDVRGVYCASVIISLLNLPVDLTHDSPAWNDTSPTLFTGIPDYIRRCQTYEGGISAAPNTEAHGAYAFCALACLSILDEPSRIIPTSLDIPRFISWLTSRQYAPEGGFSGRTNKLVDGCYSHWIGGCFPMIEAALGWSESVGVIEGQSGLATSAAAQSLLHREGLIRYILCCCQEESNRGGLRDKPGKKPDPYHTCYVLSGLSSAQRQWRYKRSVGTSPTTGNTSGKWWVSPFYGEMHIFDEQDWVRPIHPVYAIPDACQENMKRYFAAKAGF